MSGGVAVQYNAIVPLQSNQVENGGEVFNCSECCQSASCVCCGDLDGGRGNGCKKCSCQSKIPSSVNECFGGSGCCYFKGSACVGGCSTSCGGSCSVNATIFDTSQILTVNVSCSTAQSYIADPTLVGNVLNASQVQTQCSTVSQQQCCKGDTTLGPGLCGPFWGPNNYSGACDTIMTNYCNILPADSLCACLTSGLPSPECTDSTCHDTNAMKLSNMLNNQCQGNYMTCQQYINLLNSNQEAINNFIQNNTFSQTCTQNAPTSTSSSTLQWVLIAVGVVLGIGLIGGVAALVIRNKKRSVHQPNRPIQHSSNVNRPIQHSSSVNRPIQHSSNINHPIQHSSSVNRPIQHSASVNRPIQYSPNRSVQHTNQVPVQHQNQHPIQYSNKNPVQQHPVSSRPPAQYRTPVHSTSQTLPRTFSTRIPNTSSSNRVNSAPVTQKV